MSTNTEYFTIQYSSGQYSFDLDTVISIWIGLVSNQMVLHIQCFEGRAQSFFENLPLGVHNSYAVHKHSNDFLTLQTKEITAS